MNSTTERIKYRALLIGMIIANLLLLARVFLPQLRSSPDIPQDAVEFSKPIRYSLSQSYLVSGKKIPNLKLTSLGNHEVLLHRFLKSKDTVLLVYSEVDCNVCVDSLLAGCNELVRQSQDSSRVIGIAYSSNLSCLRRLVRINGLKFMFLWDPSNEIRARLNLHSTPAVFVVNEEMRITNAFFPVVDLPQLNQAFFDYASQVLREKETHTSLQVSIV